MRNFIIKAEDVCKKYFISREEKASYATLRDVVTQSTNRFFKKGLRNVSTYEEFWALKNVSFEIKQGDTVGIIGRNGAGKSTLLKILSRITEPSAGRIELHGRISSLLEVGTGFHPELTGRENIFLNGAILGMKREEIKKKFDEIVDFSGIERFLDTPVKRYSSGMYVRLAFAVAAFLEPEILIVDEVLAVGDAEFQKKCLGRMKDVSVNDGRTVLFVSHNMAAIQNLCTSALLLEAGVITGNGPVDEIIDRYQKKMASNREVKAFKDKKIFISNFEIFIDNVLHQNATMFATNLFVISIEADRDIEEAYAGIGFNDMSGNRLFTLFSKQVQKKYKIKAGTNKFTCQVEKFPLKPGTYIIEIYFGDGHTVYDYYDRGLQLEVVTSKLLSFSLIPDHTQGHFVVGQKWQ